MTHAQKRLRERYGISSTKSIIKKMSRMIQHESPKPEFVRKGKGCADIYKVQIGKRAIPVVYHRYYKNIVTVLPEGAVKNYTK